MREKVAKIAAVMDQIWSIGKRRLGKDEENLLFDGVDSRKLWSGNLKLEEEKEDREGT